MEEIECRKRANEAGFEDEDQAEEEAWHVMHAMRRIDRHERDNGREHKHQRAQSIDAKVILDADRRYPLAVPLDEANATVSGNARPDEESKREACKRGEQRNPARMPAREESDARADNRQHGEERQERKPGGKVV